MSGDAYDAEADTGLNEYVVTLIQAHREDATGGCACGSTEPHAEHLWRTLCDTVLRASEGTDTALPTVWSGPRRCWRARRGLLRPKMGFGVGEWLGKTPIARSATGGRETQSADRHEAVGPEARGDRHQAGGGVPEGRPGFLPPRGYATGGFVGGGGPGTDQVRARMAEGEYFGHPSVARGAL